MYPIFITFSPAKAGDDTATAYFRATGGIVRSAKLHGTSAQSDVRLSGARSGAMLTVRTSPNPWFRASSSPLVLHVAGVPAAEVSVRLYGLLGQEVAHADSKLDGIGAAELMLGLQGLPVGSYVYRVESGGEISSGHVVVE